ncbi:MAG: hypothetical protein ABI723_26870 [Bacteroidia bacterium]
MEKTRLTTSLAFEMFALLCIPFVMLTAISNYQINLQVILLVILIFAFEGFLFYYLFKLKTIEFDDNYVYIVSDSSEESVPLENIRAIKLTMAGINKKDFWKMNYIDTNNDEKSLSFVPKISLTQLAANRLITQSFINILRVLNFTTLATTAF